MHTFIRILTGIIALQHVYILWMEMIAWETLGRKIFKGALPDELFSPVKGLAANMGLYNGFLAAGLTWSFFVSDPAWSDNIAVFFLSCITVAGIFGGFTAGRKIFYVQALPAVLTLTLLLGSKYLS